MKKTNNHLKKIKRLMFFSFLISLCLPLLVHAQNLDLKGKVLNASTNEPIVGASILLKGTSIGALTDINGEFSLSAPMGSTIIVSFIGMTRKEVLVTGSPMSILLDEELLGLNEVIVTGYSTQRKADLTGSVSVVTVDNLSSNTSGSVMRDRKSVV